MNLDDFARETYGRKYWLVKIQSWLMIRWWKFLARIGLCRCDSTFGGVGDKWHYCITCKKKVYNEEWKEEKKALKSTK